MVGTIGAGDVAGVASFLRSNSGDVVRERLDSVEGVGISASGMYPNCPFRYFLGARVSLDRVFERLSREVVDCGGDEVFEECSVSVKAVSVK